MSKLWERPVAGAASFACTPQELLAKFDADPAYEARYLFWVTHGATPPDDSQHDKDAVEDEVAP